MAEVTNDLIYEVLKQIQGRLAGVDHKVDELKAEMQAFRGHMVALQQDIHNVYTTLARHETRFDRIERRLGLIDPVSL